MVPPASQVLGKPCPGAWLHGMIFLMNRHLNFPTPQLQDAINHLAGPGLEARKTGLDLVSLGRVKDRVITEDAYICTVTQRSRWGVEIDLPEVQCAVPVEVDDIVSIELVQGNPLLGIYCTPVRPKGVNALIFAGPRVGEWGNDASAPASHRALNAAFQSYVYPFAGVHGGALSQVLFDVEELFTIQSPHSVLAIDFSYAAVGGVYGYYLEEQPPTHEHDLMGNTASGGGGTSSHSHGLMGPTAYPTWIPVPPIQRGPDWPIRCGQATLQIDFIDEDGNVVASNSPPGFRTLNNTLGIGGGIPRRDTPSIFNVGGAQYSSYLYPGRFSNTGAQRYILAGDDLVEVVGKELMIRVSAPGGSHLVQAEESIEWWNNDQIWKYLFQEAPDNPTRWMGFRDVELTLVEIGTGSA